MPPEEDRACTAIGNMHENFGEDRTCSSEDMIADRQTHADTHTYMLITILRSPIGGGVTKINPITGLAPMSSLGLSNVLA